MEVPGVGAYPGHGWSRHGQALGSPVPFPDLAGVGPPSPWRGDMVDTVLALSSVLLTAAQIILDYSRQRAQDRDREEGDADETGR